MNFNTRCVCCNKVSSKEIETDIGDYSKSEFVIDPVTPDAFICKECKEWHEDLMMNYHQKDDPYGWDRENDSDERIVLEIPLTNNGVSND